MDKRDRYISNLSELIRQKTVSTYENKDFAAFYEFHDVLRRVFPHISGVCEWEEFEASILLRWKGKDPSHPKLFMNHFDVVPVQEEGWSHPAFCGEVFDGKLWGRGTLDTKGGLWAMLQAADDLAAEGFVPEHDIYFESSSCEETTFEGARHFADELEKRGIRFDLVIDEGGMIMYEPIGGVKATCAMVGMGERGVYSLKFTARSNGGHASAPEKNTPLVRLGRFMAEADKNGVFKVEISPVIEEMFRRFSDSVSFPLNIVYKHPDWFRPILKKLMPDMSGTARALVQTTIAFTMAGGSEAYNVIPSEAYVIGNMRTSHHQTFDESFEAIRKIAGKYDLETEVVEMGIDSPLCDYRTKEFKLIEEAIDHSFENVKTVPYIMTGGSDARFMGRLTDNCYHFVPFIIDKQQLGSIHGLDENVDVSTLEPAVSFYTYIMKEGRV